MMNVNRTLIGVSLGGVLLLIFSGCATQSSERVDVRGSYPNVGRGNAQAEKNPGTLIVFTPTVTDLDSDHSMTSGSYEPPCVVHSGYTIFDTGGNRVEYVRNHSMLPSTDEPPAEIALAPGRYLIRTDQPAQGPSLFWVTVEPQHETRVDVAKIPKVVAPTPTLTPEPEVR
jgi:hypothetical protein